MIYRVLIASLLMIATLVSPSISQEGTRVSDEELEKWASKKFAFAGKHDYTNYAVAIMHDTDGSATRAQVSPRQRGRVEDRYYKMDNGQYCISKDSKQTWLCRYVYQIGENKYLLDNGRKENRSIFYKMEIDG